MWAHPWMRRGLVRRSVAGWQTLPPETQADIFAPNVEPEVIKTAYQNDNTASSSSHKLACVAWGGMPSATLAAALARQQRQEAPVPPRVPTHLLPCPPVCSGG